MMRYKIVLVPFPFDDFSGTKVRPALCLTEPVGPLRHVVLAFITSRVMPSLGISDVVVATNDPDFASTGLLVSSTIQLHHLMTAKTTFIQRELGQLSPKMQTQIKERLQKLFHLK